MDSDHYATLGVDPEVGTEEVKDAYWRLATPHHVVLASVGLGGRRGPDGGPASERDRARVAEAEAALARLDESYAVLVDPDARLRYHAGLAGVDLGRLPAIIEEAVSDLDLEVEIQGGGSAALPTRPACVVCGGVPAVPAVLKAVTGTLVSYRTEVVREAFCGRCGTAMFRRLQTRTLLRGWWGVLAVLHNWGAVTSNAAMARRFAALGEAERPDPAAHPPLDPGPALWRRPKLLLAAVVAVGLVAAAVLDTFVW